MKKLQKLNGKKLNKKEQQAVNGGGIVGDQGGGCRFENQHCIVISGSGVKNGYCHLVSPADDFWICVV